ncbi:MAG TPA: hypothetical protein DG942_03335 [Ruminococcaceae bacterium]|nr:hypothetical protein [Oscillospiraceae bacterium]
MTKTLSVLSARKASLQKKKSKKGFTLIELVIVIAILAIIATIAIPAVVNTLSNANKSTDATNAQELESTIKTAQAEVAAQASSPSDRVKTLGTGGDMATLLKTYGVDIDLTNLKINGHKFYYDVGTGRVVAGNPAESGSTITGKELKSTSTYAIAGDQLTITA